MEFWCPNLRSLSLIENMKSTRIKMNHHSSLLEANLSYYTGTVFVEGRDDYKSHCYLLKEYLSDLDRVQKLTMGLYCLQVLSIFPVLSLSPTLSKRTSITLKAKITNSVLPGILNLLETSPHLEELTINMEVKKTAIKPEYSPIWENSSVFIDGERYLQSMEKTFTCLSSHLKSVVITGLGPSSGFDPKSVELKFFCLLVEFLLKKAKVLEKMFIFADTREFEKPRMSSGKQRRLRDFIKLKQLILSHPRASPNAVVQFKKFST